MLTITTFSFRTLPDERAVDLAPSVSTAAALSGYGQKIALFGPAASGVAQQNSTY
jgi:hypothetical protein